MHALESLIAYYNSCKQEDLYREVIRHIFHNLKKVEDANIYDLAEMCYVSPTTISRLCRKLGYKSFSDFKNGLANNVKNYDTLNRYVPLNEIGKHGCEKTAYLKLLTRQIKDFADHIDDESISAIVDQLHHSKKISFYTYGIFFSEPHFQEDLIMTGHECAVFSIPFEQLQDVEMLEEDSMVVMIVPVVAENAISGQIIKMIKERKAKILLLTDSKQATFLKLADYSYCFNGSMSIIDDYRFSMFINLLSMTYRGRYLS